MSEGKNRTVVVYRALRRAILEQALQRFPFGLAVDGPGGGLPRRVVSVGGEAETDHAGISLT